jgi:hypothetical protein
MQRPCVQGSIELRPHTTAVLCLPAFAQISGSQNAEFVRFSSGALVRAQSKLTEFLALMPRDAVAAAKQAVAAELAGAGVE